MIKFEEVENKDGFYIIKDLPFTDAQTATNYGVIFTALRPCEILEISEVHTTADTGSPRLLNVERLQGTEALDAGDEICKTDFALTSTANTVVRKSGFDLQNVQLSVGDRIALKDKGLNAIEGIQITIYLKPLGKGDYR